MYRNRAITPASIAFVVAIALFVAFGLVQLGVDVFPDSPAASADYFLKVNGVEGESSGP